MRRRLLCSVVAFAMASGCGRGAGSTGDALSSGAPSAVARSASAHPGGAPPEHAKLDIVELADAEDVFVPPPTDLPRGGSVLSETVPFGSTRQEVPKDIVAKACVPPVHCDKEGDKTFVDLPLGATHSYLRVVLQPNESIEDTLARADAYVKTLHPPDGTRFERGLLFEIDATTKVNEAVGVRTYLVRGESVVTEKGVVDALVKDDGKASVRITLASDASARFESFTRANTKRRIAVIVDGEVLTTPVVESTIRGGVLTVVLGTKDAATDAELSEAARLAKALRPPH